MQLAHNKDVSVVLSFVIGDHNISRVPTMISLAERLGVDVCRFTTLHLISEEEQRYKNKTLRNLPETYRDLMRRKDYNVDIHVSPPISAQYLGYYCESLASHLCVDPQQRLAPCCHIPWSDKVGNFGTQTGNPINTDAAVTMRSQFIRAEAARDESLLPESCRLCSRRLIGKFVFSKDKRDWSFVHDNA